MIISGKYPMPRYGKYSKPYSSELKARFKWADVRPANFIYNSTCDEAIEFDRITLYKGVVVSRVVSQDGKTVTEKKMNLIKYPGGSYYFDGEVINEETFKKEGTLLVHEKVETTGRYSIGFDNNIVAKVEDELTYRVDPKNGKVITPVYSSVQDEVIREYTDYSLEERDIVGEKLDKLLAFKTRNIYPILALYGNFKAEQEAKKLGYTKKRNKK